MVAVLEVVDVVVGVTECPSVKSAGSIFCWCFGVVASNEIVFERYERL